MIIQGILDFISQWLAGLVRLIPAMPSQMTDALGMATNAGAAMATGLAKFGILIPWDVVGACMTIWWGAMTFWAAMLIVRLVLWIVGR